ncbi:MAG: 4-hydroxythreonine-4-phosphate dehydrogenase PdxA, partial [Burkholderiaceae bacterium]
MARLLSQPDITAHANIVLAGDAWLWQDGQAIAKVNVPTQAVQSLAEAKTRPNQHLPAFLAVNTLDPAQVQRSHAQAVCGKSVLDVLNLCMDAAKAGEVDAICFAPLNKFAMKQGGLKHEDEL